MIQGSAPSFTVAPGVRPGAGREKSRMSLKFRVTVEIEGASPETLKMRFEFSDEEGSDVEFSSTYDLPDDVSGELGALAVEFTNNITDLVLRKMH
jgi:hypothetical protein